MELIDANNKLISAEEIKRKAKLAGTHAGTYWVNAVAPLIRQLPHHQRQRMCDRAFQVSTNIIPTPTMDNILLPALIAKPNPDTIRWTTLGQQYGVDYRYIAASYLRSFERLLARTDDITRAKLTKRSNVTNTSILQIITSICVQRISSRADLNALIGTGKFPNTLANFAKYDTFATAAERHIASVQRRTRLANKRYDDNTSWAHWRNERAVTIRDRADDITQRLLSYLHDNPGASPIKYLATLCTTVSKRPPLAAVLMYAHKHIFPRLARQQRWDIAETINAHALVFANSPALAGPKHLTSRIIISRLTGTLLPDTPAPGDDKARITEMVARCRGMDRVK